MSPNIEQHELKKTTLDRKLDHNTVIEVVECHIKLLTLT